MTTDLMQIIERTNPRKAVPRGRGSQIEPRHISPPPFSFYTFRGFDPGSLRHGPADRRTQVTHRHVAMGGSPLQMYPIKPTLKSATYRKK